MADETETGANKDEPEPWAKAIGVVALIALAVGVVFAVIGIYPNKIPASKNPSFVDDIFASRVVVLSVRIALMFAAGYVVISVVGLIIGRRWLTQVGPFRTDAPVAELNQEAEQTQEALGSALATIDTLEERLKESDRALERSNTDLTAVLAYLDSIERDKGN